MVCRVAYLLSFDPRVAAQLRKRYDWYLDDFCDEEQIGGNGD